MLPRDSLVSAANWTSSSIADSAEVSCITSRHGKQQSCSSIDAMECLMSPLLLTLIIGKLISYSVIKRIKETRDMVFYRNSSRVFPRSKYFPTSRANSEFRKLARNNSFAIHLCATDWMASVLTDPTLNIQLNYCCWRLSIKKVDWSSVDDDAVGGMSVSAGVIEEVEKT